jgi:two-component system sensor histidine kinase UhpB
MMDGVLRVPLELKIVAASAACSGVAFGLGWTAAWTVRRSAFQADSLVIALAVGLAWVMIAAWLSAGIIRIALAPLRHLEDAAARNERGDLAARASLSRLADRDIARLVCAFNQALDQQVAHRERLRELARRCLRSEEQTNRRIAVELREGPGQRLASLLLRLQRAERGGDRSALEDMLEEARGEIATALDIVGRHPGDRVERLLDDLGVAGAVEWQTRQIEREYGLDLSVAVEFVDRALSRQARIALLLFVREALENVGRHAASNKASVRVRHAGDRVVAEVADDGRGFEHREAVARGLGLLRMEEGIAALGGKLYVISAPSSGARLKAEIPVRVWRPTAAGRTASEGVA